MARGGGGVDNTAVVTMRVCEACGRSIQGLMPRRLLKAGAVWNLLESLRGVRLLVPAALGDVYPICLFLDVCVSALALPGLTGLPPPPPFSPMPTHSLSLLSSPSSVWLPRPPRAGAEWRELQARRSGSETSAGYSSLLRSLLLWSLGVGVGASREAAGDWGGRRRRRPGRDESFSPDRELKGPAWSA